MWRKGPPHVHTTEATYQQQQQHVHWLKCALVQPVWKTVWRFLKILKTELLYTHTHTEYYSAIKKYKILPFATT